MRRRSSKASGLFKAENDIHILNGLARGSLHHIVDGAADYEPAGAPVEMQRHMAVVG